MDVENIVQSLKRKDYDDYLLDQFFTLPNKKIKQFEPLELMSDFAPIQIGGIDYVDTLPVLIYTLDQEDVWLYGWETDGKGEAFLLLSIKTHRHIMGDHPIQVKLRRMIIVHNGKLPCKENMWTLFENKVKIHHPLSTSLLCPEGITESDITADYKSTLLFKEWNNRCKNCLSSELSTDKIRSTAVKITANQMWDRVAMEPYFASQI